MSIAAYADWLDQPIFNRQPFADFAEPAPLPPPPTDWNRIARDWAFLIVLGLLAFQAIRGCRPNPGPNPGPDVAGMRVMILEESADRAGLSFEQQQIFNSVPIREAIEAAKGELLVLDKDDSTDKLRADWKSIWGRITLPPPVVVIANKRGATEFALPADVPAMLSKIERAAK